MSQKLLDELTKRNEVLKELLILERMYAKFIHELDNDVSMKDAIDIVLAEKNHIEKEIEKEVELIIQEYY